jgi:hypothetical protein
MKGQQVFFQISILAIILILIFAHTYRAARTTHPLLVRLGAKHPQALMAGYWVWVLSEDNLPFIILPRYTCPQTEQREGKGGLYMGCMVGKAD